MNNSTNRTTNVNYNVSASSHELWKLRRIPGNYIYQIFTAENVRETFFSLCNKLDISWEINDAERTGHAYGDDIALSHGTILGITFNEKRKIEVTEFLKSIVPAKAEHTVKWYYLNEKNEISNNSMELKGPSPKNEFYPWMPKPINTYAKDFLSSSANVLLLLGAPGTGKTSFIRGLIREMKCETWVTYDPHLQTNEQFYIQFANANSNDPRCLVVEDADEMLSKRTEGNKIMNRILNIADGLIALPTRKIIFSTNLPGITSIDDALLRPGRCFGAIKFRELIQSEALAACRSVGIERVITKGKLTLSEALNNKQEMHITMQSIGF